MIINDNIIFVVGMPRSGTTLLNYILHAHSEITITPETHFFDKFFNKYKNLNSFTIKESKTILNSYLNSEDIDILDFTIQDKNEIIKEAIQSNFIPKKIFYNILKKYSQKSDSRIIGEKTPIHLEYVPTLNEWFPNAKFLIIYRDPRDVCLSLKNVPWNEGNCKKNAKRWNKYIQLSNNYKEDTLLSSKIMEIKYEELIVKPIDIVKNICSHINIHYEEQMLKYYENITKQCKELKVVTWKDKNKESIDKFNSNKWINKLSLNEIDEIENITLLNLKEKGYSLYLDLKKDYL